MHKGFLSALFENEVADLSESECRITVQNLQCKSKSGKIGDSALLYRDRYACLDDLPGNYHTYMYMVKNEVF